MNLRLVYGLGKTADDEAISFNLDLLQKINTTICPISIEQAFEYYQSICRLPHIFTVKGLIPPRELFRTARGYMINNSLWLLKDEEVVYFWGSREITDTLEEILQKGRSYLEGLC